MEKKIFVSVLINGAFMQLSEKIPATLDGDILTIKNKKFSLKKTPVQIGRVNIVYKKGNKMFGKAVPFYA